MAKLSEKDVEFLKKKRKQSKKWLYFFDRLCLIVKVLTIAWRILIKVGYVLLFLMAFVYALSNHNIPHDIIIALNKITPIMER